MRSFHVALLLALAACSILALSGRGGASEWTVTDKVVLGEEDLLVDDNITVVSGGLLELRGTILTFNCSRPGQYILSVQRGGGLVAMTSTGGRSPSIKPANPSAQTWVKVESAATLRLEDLHVEDCGYYNPLGINEFYPAISISDVEGLVVRRCHFRDCLRTLHLSTCSNAIIEDNTIVNLTGGYGIETYGLTDSRLTDNTISGTGAGTGIVCYSSDGLRLSRNDVMGTARCLELWRCDEAVVEGGQLLPSGREAVYITGSKLVLFEGIEIDGGPGGNAASSGLVLEYISTVTVTKCTLRHLQVAIKILNPRGFSPSFSLLSDNLISSCGVGVVLASSNNTLRGNILRGCACGVKVTDEPWLMQPELRADASGNELVQCIFEGCELAIELQNASMTTIRSCDLSGGRAHMTAIASKGTREMDCRHTSWSETALTVLGGDYHATNISLSKGPLGIRLERGASAWIEQSQLEALTLTASSVGSSTLDLVNTSHPRSYDVDSSSTVRIWWDVEVEVDYESGASITIPGTLLINDCVGRQVGSHHCLPSGPPVLATVLELEVVGTARDNRTPHAFEVAAQGRVCSATMGITRFTRIHLLLDDVAPTIEVDEPTVGALNRTPVRFAGCAMDGIHGPVDYSMLVDGEEVLSGTGIWAQEMWLSDGEHSITYVATDGSNNTATHRSMLRVDTEPPILEVTEPTALESVISSDRVRIAGRVFGHIVLLLDDEEVPVDVSSFAVERALDRDGEYVLELVALDDLGNSVTVTVRITRDTVPPRLELDEHDALTREAVFLVAGTTDWSGSLVTVEGVTVNVLPGGRFSSFLDLEEGPNSFLFRACDEAGNEAARWINATLDTTLDLRVIAPLDGTTFDVEDIEVLAQAEPGATLRLAGDSWREADAMGNWRTGITLMEGSNAIVLEAQDPAGNEASATVTVVFVPPPVEPTGGVPVGAIIAILAVSIAVAVIVFVTGRHRSA